MVSLKTKVLIETLDLTSGEESTRQEYSHFCGATLISSSMILTAAHCLDLLMKIAPSVSSHELIIPCPNGNSKCKTTFTPDKNFYAFISEYSQTEKDQHEELRLFSTDDIILHEEYDRETGRNDIALIKLRKASNSPIVKLFAERSLLLNIEDSGLQVIGWGRTESTDQENSRLNIFPDILQKAILRIVPNYICSSHYVNMGSRLVVTSAMLCAGDFMNEEYHHNRQDSCEGDSGGPLLIRNPDNAELTYQIGIVSWGSGCGKNPGVYTNIQSFLDWEPLRGSIFISM